MDENNGRSRTGADAQALKDELFRRAKYGEITGEEADVHAIRLGLDSLSDKPGPDRHRPELLAYWTLPMAVAWIAYLDLDEVREWSLPYRSECFDWRWQRWRVGFDGPVHEGWHLEQRHKPTLSLLSLSSIHDDVTDDKKLAMPVKAAREALWMALREGFFTATGIDTETGRRVEISALDWHELVPVEATDETDEVRRGLLSEGYREVLIPSKPLRGFWRRQERPKYVLPPTILPIGYGYMPLFCAAQWIATEGGKVEIDPAEVEVWRPAYTNLLAAIASGAVKLVGVEGHETKPVPTHLVVGLSVDYPYAEPTLEMILSDELVLRCYPYVNEDYWRKGFDDALVDRSGTRWRRLSVEKADVGKLWPFAMTPETATGLPGRPALSRHLIEDELKRLAIAGELSPSLREQAEVLIAWLRSAHPKHAPPKTGTLENNIRNEYRRLKATK
ncbi:hypothetical protein [Mesorhizobium sp. KR9-304]|uniref:hypothetical protein n=1 Tax=Mesorhizobium sp. KR9-304 TaxID=3156614 RepID=UPI0032B33FB5